MVTEFLECPCKTLASHTSTIALTKKHSDDIIKISNRLVLKEEMIVNYLGSAWILKLKVEGGMSLQDGSQRKAESLSRKGSQALESQCVTLPVTHGSWNHSPIVTWN